MPKMSGENFNPHVSTGVAPKEYLDKMLAEPFENFTFSPAGATVYQLDRFGTAAKKLKEWDLKRIDSISSNGVLMCNPFEVKMVSTPPNGTRNYATSYATWEGKRVKLRNQPRQWNASLKHHVGPHTIDESIVRNRACPGMDVLKVRADIQPRVDLELVVRLDAGSIPWTKNGLRQRSELAADTVKVPADAERHVVFRSGCHLPGRD